MDARGAILGLTRGSNRSHIVRAALEAMCYQSFDVFHLMEEEGGVEIEKLMVDGGAVANNFLMQFQADILQRPLLRPSLIESTSLGAAFLAGLKSGFWSTGEDLIKLKTMDQQFLPKLDIESRNALVGGWHKALRQTQAL